MANTKSTREILFIGKYPAAGQTCWEAQVSLRFADARRGCQHLFPGGVVGQFEFSEAASLQS